MKRVVVLASGAGTNLTAIIEAIKSKKLFNCELVGVISNYDSMAVKIAMNNKINSIFVPWIRDKNTRESYDLHLVDKIQTYAPDLIILAGWNHILTEAFINKLNYVDIINLHPALLGKFPGNNAIEDAWNAYQKGLVKHTGVMVHKVTSVLDVGEVVHQEKIEIKSDDTILTLKNRIQAREKGVLIHAIQKLTTPFLYRGKVKDVYEVDDDSLLIVHTDRLSASNRYVCDIEGKGHMLCRLSNYYFNATQYIIPNHIIDTQDNCMLVHKCEQIPIEFIMRAYITGSLWKTYSQGNRTYCGIDLPDGLKNNQRLDVPILTPTTKDEFDLPISVEQIVEKGILSQKDLDYISDCVHKLFIEGQYHSKVFRPWGFYETVLKDKRWQVKIIHVKPGDKLSLQMHHHRSEHWIVVIGTAKVELDNESTILAENHSIYIPLGSKHRLSNPGKIPLILIEVQSGSYVGEDDIVRFKDKYGR